MPRGTRQQKANEEETDLPCAGKLSRPVSGVFFVIILVDSNSNFVFVDIISKKQNRFLCVRSPLTYNVALHLHMCCDICTHMC